jgi:peptidoglycan/xylan/chitin deacetylase (PgdA/CDA1 family)
MQTSTPLSPRRRALRAAQRALYWSGAGWVWTQLRGGGGVILMYHSVAGDPAQPFVDPAWHMSPRRFERQMRFLRRHRRVVGLDALLAELRRERGPARGTVAITFDDGYLDNLEVAAPILASLGLPATLYLPTAVVDRREPQWVDRLYTAFRTRTRERLTLPDGAPVDLGSPAARLAAYHAFNEVLIAASRDEREARLARVVEELAPAARPPRLTLGWDEVRQLVERHPGFEIGIHTAEHTDMTAHALEPLRRELEGALATAERELGRRPRHFSFPYARDNPETRALVRSLGFASAVGSGADPLIGPSHDPFRLPRLDPRVDATLFRFQTSGAHPGLARAWLGRG